MGIITLTDRISVSVRAKNETESNSQKRATGKNIAKALGNGNISDSLADQLGNTSKPTIADEQGREWVSMSDIIAAGKRMQQEGAFDEKTTYRYGNVAGIRLSSLPFNPHPGFEHRDDDYYNAYGPVYNTDGSYDIYAVARDADRYIYGAVRYINKSNDICYETLHNKYDDQGGYLSSGCPAYMVTKSTGSYYSTTYISASIVNKPFNYIAVPVTNLGKIGVDIQNVPSFLDDLGEKTEETSGGSLIDWTKPDDEIEEDIRNLHETWDVSDHAGSTTANGTYVLAGPIEFNPGD